MSGVDMSGSRSCDSHEYERIDSLDSGHSSSSSSRYSATSPGNHRKTKVKRSFFFCIVVATLVVAAIVSFNFLQDIISLEQSVALTHKVMHITDPHIDLFFDPMQSVAKGACHSCDLAKYHTPSRSSSHSKSNINLSSLLCPSEEEVKLHVERVQLSDFPTIERGDYLFGRYGCDPPLLLWTSLLASMQLQDASPAVIVFTGDMSPHSYPDDSFAVNEHTTLDELCLTKFYVTKLLFQQLVETFPDTQWAYSIGNNDHFPKNVYWQPYINMLGKMLLDIGFFHQQQYEQFVSFGCSFVDVEGVRYLSINMNLFIPKGEFIAPGGTSVVPRMLLWLKESLRKAEEFDIPVYIVGHQPLSTRFGFDEMDIHGDYFLQFKQILEQYSSIIRVGLFGHNNVENFIQVLGPPPRLQPIFPAIVATGVSPRAPNQPSYTVLFKSTETGIIADFVQHSFHLKKENRALLKLTNGFTTRDSQLRVVSPTSVLGDGWVASDTPWSILSGAKNFTTDTLSNFISKVESDHNSFFAIEILKRGGFIGNQVPENFMCEALHDREEDMMKCLFPQQDKQCWDPEYWVK